MVGHNIKASNHTPNRLHVLGVEAELEGFFEYPELTEAKH